MTFATETKTLTDLQFTARIAERRLAQRAILERTDVDIDAYDRITRFLNDQFQQTFNTEECAIVARTDTVTAQALLNLAVRAGDIRAEVLPTQTLYTYR